MCKKKLLFATSQRSSCLLPSPSLNSPLLNLRASLLWPECLGPPQIHVKALPAMWWHLELGPLEAIRLEEILRIRMASRLWIK